MPHFLKYDHQNYNLSQNLILKFASDRCADSQLHYAVRSGDYDVCSTLLRSGAKTDIAGSDGK